MRILIANPFGIGDVLFTLPLIQQIRSQRPKAVIGYLCNRRTEELVSLWPEIQWHRPFELRAIWRRSKCSGWKEFHLLREEIRREEFNMLIDLSLGWHAGWTAWSAGIPRRIGFDYRQRGRFLTERIPLAGFERQPIPEEYLDLLPKIGLAKPASSGIHLELPPEAGREAEQILQKLGIAADAPLLGVVPGGGASWGNQARFKQWAPERFAEAAERLAASHRMTPLLLGDASEKELLESVRRRMSAKTAVISPAPSLLLLAALLRRCKLVIGNDSGSMHLASAVGTRTLSIFGPVDASVYGPYPFPGQETLHRVAAHGLTCRPCYRQFRFPGCPWDNACLKDLPTEQVLQSARELLETA